MLQCCESTGLVLFRYPFLAWQLVSPADRLRRPFREITVEMEVRVLCPGGIRALHLHHHDLSSLHTNRFLLLLNLVICHSFCCPQRPLFPATYTSRLRLYFKYYTLTSRQDEAVYYYFPRCPRGFCLYRPGHREPDQCPRWPLRCRPGRG